MSEYEVALATALYYCRFVPGSFAKRFCRDIYERCVHPHRGPGMLAVGLGCCLRPVLTGPTPELSAKQRKLLWELGWKHRRQIVNQRGFSLSILEAHKSAYAEWEDVKPPEQAAFERLLCDDPDDWETRAIYADWLEDRGELARAQAQRWMAGLQIRPALQFGGLIRRWQWVISSSSKGGPVPVPGPSGALFEVAGTSRINAERRLSRLFEA